MKRLGVVVVVFILMLGVLPFVSGGAGVALQFEVPKVTVFANSYVKFSDRVLIPRDKFGGCSVSGVTVFYGADPEILALVKSITYHLDDAGNLVIVWEFEGFFAGFSGGKSAGQLDFGRVLVSCSGGESKDIELSAKLVFQEVKFVSFTADVVGSSKFDARAYSEGGLYTFVLLPYVRVKVVGVLSYPPERQVTLTVRVVGRGVDVSKNVTLSSRSTSFSVVFDNLVLSPDGYDVGVYLNGYRVASYSVTREELENKDLEYGVVTVSRPFLTVKSEKGRTEYRLASYVTVQSSGLESIRVVFASSNGGINADVANLGDGAVKKVVSGPIPPAVVESGDFRFTQVVTVDWGNGYRSSITDNIGFGMGGVAGFVSLVIMSVFYFAFVAGAFAVIAGLISARHELITGGVFMLVLSTVIFVVPSILAGIVSVLKGFGVPDPVGVSNVNLNNFGTKVGIAIQYISFEAIDTGTWLLNVGYAMLSSGGVFGILSLLTLGGFSGLAKELIMLAFLSLIAGSALLLFSQLFIVVVAFTIAILFITLVVSAVYGIFVGSPQQTVSSGLTIAVYLSVILLLPSLFNVIGLAGSYAIESMKAGGALLGKLPIGKSFFIGLVAGLFKVYVLVVLLRASFDRVMQLLHSFGGGGVA